MVELTPPEQRRYARVLSAAVWLGLGVLAVTFVAYLAGFGDSRVPVEILPQVWGQPARPALADPLSLGAIGWLALSSCAGLAATLLVYARRADRLYAALCALQILVLALAASGIFTLGH